MSDTADLVRVRLLAELYLGGHARPHAPGSIVALPKHQAEALIANGHAELA